MLAVSHLTGEGVEGTQAPTPGIGAVAPAGQGQLTPPGGLGHGQAGLAFEGEFVQIQQHFTHGIGPHLLPALLQVSHFRPIVWVGAVQIGPRPLASDAQAQQQPGQAAERRQTQPGAARQQRSQCPARLAVTLLLGRLMQDI